MLAINTGHTNVAMLFTRLLLLPFAVASSVTLYVSSVPVTSDAAVIPSPIPLAQIEYDADQPVGTLSSYTPPTGSYSPDHLLRIGLTDTESGEWHGIVTSAASFSTQYHQKFVLHVDDKGIPFHIGFSTSAPKTKDDRVSVEIVQRAPGPKPVLNKPIVLNAEGKIETKEPEKTFLQKYVESESRRRDYSFQPPTSECVKGKYSKRLTLSCAKNRYWWVVALFLVVQLVAGGDDKK